MCLVLAAFWLALWYAGGTESCACIGCSTQMCYTVCQYDCTECCKCCVFFDIRAGKRRQTTAVDILRRRLLDKLSSSVLASAAGSTFPRQRAIDDDDDDDVENVQLDNPRTWRLWAISSRLAYNPHLLQPQQSSIDGHMITSE